MPSLNTVEQNRVISLSKELTKVLPQRTEQSMDLSQCKVYWKQIALLQDLEILLNATRSTGQLLAVQELLGSRVQLVDPVFNPFRLAISSSFSLKAAWRVKAHSSHPLSPSSGNPSYFLSAPPLSSVATNLLEGLRPKMTEKPVIHLFKEWQKCLSTVRPIPLADGSSVAVVFVLEAVASDGLPLIELEADHSSSQSAKMGPLTSISLTNDEV
jgi:hypothetical protein